MVIITINVNSLSLVINQIEVNDQIIELENISARKVIVNRLKN